MVGWIDDQINERFGYRGMESRWTEGWMDREVKWIGVE